MKKKLTLLAFSLLLAVGWTSNASAQKLPDRTLTDRFTAVAEITQEECTIDAESMDGPIAHSHSAAPAKKTGQRRFGPFRAGQELDMKSVTKAQADAWTYTWTDASNASHTSAFSEVAKDPYQMYELLRQVYMDPRFPGPTYSAYTKNDVRERKVYYGAIQGGWDIDGPVQSNYTLSYVDGGQEVTYNPVIQFGDMTISGDTEHAMIYSITITSGNKTLFSWNYETDGDASSSSTGHWPLGMNISNWGYWSNSGVRYALGFNEDDNGNVIPITLDDWLFMGYSNLTVTISANSNSSSANGTLSVNGDQKTVTRNSSTPTNYTWNIYGSNNTYSYAHYDPDYYKPTEEGYTALIVAVKNETVQETSSSEYDGSYFNSKAEIINYFSNNIDSIQLLTDGLRIGKGSDYSIGTVFNCEGTYNKFFFLGKGQARQKSDVVRNREFLKEHAMAEYVPFKEMFEQFSPTGVEAGDEITNFYSLMNEGNVYPVEHDCRAVIRLNHQFSMSGNDGTKAYAMTGMNFFIPDYRLKYWENTYTYRSVDYTVDGRCVNHYQAVSADGNPALNRSQVFRKPGNIGIWYAQYNQDYAPRVGLYRITLEAVATPVDYDYNEGNRNYAVTLTWVSSLNEMTGHDVPQIYTVWYWDPITGEKKHVEAIGVTDGQTGLTTITYLVEQYPTSYKIEYIVEGHPVDDTHSHMVAISNVDDVIIPGWNDFIGLDLDHHESDFVVSDMANWYRNFLVVVNEDLANGLTIDQITDPVQPMNEFNLYRYEYGENNDTINMKQIATLKFKNPTTEQVEYEITYDENNEQEQYKPQDDTHKYDLDEDHLDVPLTGVVRIKGNGDIVIWPNGYFVNFKSIVIKNNGTVVASWNADVDSDLPNGWYMSSGSRFEEYVTTNTSDKVGYVDGGGYIYIPNMVTSSNYDKLTVEIEAYNDGSNVARIAVNDKSKNISSTPGTTYTWGLGTQIPISPNAAPKRDYNGSITMPIAGKGNSNSNVNINNSNKR